MFFGAIEMVLVGWIKPTRVFFAWKMDFPAPMSLPVRPNIYCFNYRPKNRTTNKNTSISNTCMYSLIKK